ncbi:MAG: N-acylmannosamine kinase [Patescibacteria group bacterium]|nr:N-acylmannosamine kinase [Patescibacteria group bacterium]
MYLAIDIGGTKTLVASINASGEIVKSNKFPTPVDYTDFKKELKANIHNLDTTFSRGAVAAPGKIDRNHGVLLACSNLTWVNVPLEADIEQMAHCPIRLENDTKLAGLSEAIHIIDEFKRVLYVTISTGISSALVVDGILDKGMLDSESGQILLEHEGKIRTWESFASGRAIVKKYGKRASDIDSARDWKMISKNIAVGLIDLIAIVQPEVIIIGGGVGSHFEKFKKPLNEQLQKYETPMVAIPPVIGAYKAEEAVVYGCYHLAKMSAHE